MARREDIATTAQSVRTRGRGGTGNFPSTAEPEEAGNNSRYLRYAMACLDLPPIDISDVKQVEGRAREYLEYCANNDRKPQIVGLANWLGVHRDTLHSWKTGETRGATHSDFIKKVVSMLEEIEVDFFQNGKINPTSGIFILKNHFGYRDVQDLVLEPKQSLGDGIAPEDVAQKYAELPAD